MNPPAAPYVICTHLFQFMLQFLILAFGIDVISLSVLDVICSSILLVCMIRLIPAIIIMLYYWLFRIKSYGKLLIYSTAYVHVTAQIKIMEKYSLIFLQVYDLISIFSYL
jgi:hypothetical protein